MNAVVSLPIELRKRGSAAAASAWVNSAEESGMPVLKNKSMQTVKRISGGTRP